MGERQDGRDELDRGREARAAELRRCGARTRDLLDDLEAARPDLLSIADLNRALKQVLRNQAAILDALAAGGGAASQAASRPSASTAIAVRPRPTPAKRAEPDDDDVLGWTPRKAAPRGPEEAGPTFGRAAASVCAPEDLAAPAALEPLEDEPAPAPSVPTLAHAHGAGNGAAAAPANGNGTVSAAVAGPSFEAFIPLDHLVPGGAARVLVELFDNRDKDYEKGLDKLNRWTAGGAGTPFQLRGERAYLNLDATGPESARNYEEQLMNRMGFSRRLGRLQVPGLMGIIVVYERPSS